MIILRVALAIPLRRNFDYLLSQATEKAFVKPGMRVLVPFGKNRKRVGIIMDISDKSEIAPAKLKSILSIIDQVPILSARDLKLIAWASSYYHHPLGEVLFNALPAPIRQGKPALGKKLQVWKTSSNGEDIDETELKRAPKQQAIFTLLRSSPSGLSKQQIEERIYNCSSALKSLKEKDLVQSVNVETTLAASVIQKAGFELNQEQKQVCSTIQAQSESDRVFLLEGVTGSGKTEVYIEIIKTVLAKGKQALVLSPEIGLTPQLVDRIKAQVGGMVSVIHSGVTDTERLKAWLNAKNGTASVIIGTRSAIWTPIKNPGVIIVDEEHDISYKQQDGFRYSARDVAVMRGKLEQIPVILGSATPSMESLRNVELGKSESLKLTRMAGNAKKPAIKVIDLKNRNMQGALSQPLINEIRSCIDSNKQALLFLNRRGYSPTLMCHKCGDIVDCDRCEKHMTYHKNKRLLICHHCDRRMRAPIDCTECGAAEYQQIGHGTERLEETLVEVFPNAKILRIDRDSTRMKGAMEKMIDSIKGGDADILIGTQMLAKGHHFPDLSLVGIIDTDGGLCSVDFRASERMAQLFIQVSGRAGRENDTGTVVIQTHFPEHPLLKSLVQNGYNDFSTTLMEERRVSNLPPYSYMALLRSESQSRELASDFLDKARTVLVNDDPDIEIYGPYPAPMEKKAGKLRMQMMLMSNDRKRLQGAMRSWSLKIEAMKITARVRWSLDIDPQDMV